ncbi:MAG: AmmeMemoRadiSam system protein B [Defluviicoccus sp.]
MPHVRPAAVAGLFYPAGQRELDAAVRAMLAAVPPFAADEPLPKAIIAPHAGYIYSGPVAATAYARLARLKGRVKRVVLIGPSHRVCLEGLAVPRCDAFATPLGPVAVDRAAIKDVLSLDTVTELDAAHAEEHCLEVHLPFLQEVLGTFAIVPLVVGDARTADVAAVLERLWGADETLIVVSSDLSHYLTYESARTLDAATCRAIEMLDPAVISREQACGGAAVKGLLALAKRRHLAVWTLDLRNSGDTAGDRRRVVGYGAWAFSEPTAPQPRRADEAAAETPAACASGGARELLRAHGETLLFLASASIDHGLRRGGPLPMNIGDYPEALRAQGASFVTLTRDGQLRGCVGSPEAYRPLAEDVSVNAFAAAFRDSRFGKLTRLERADLTLSISLLTPPVRIFCTTESELLADLQPNADGLIIESRGHRALFLPQVWTLLPQPLAFVHQLKSKAGLATDYWAPDFQAWRFHAVSVSSAGLAEPAA